MPKTVFPYPGGKSKYADWIVEHIPNDHVSYVEPFCGSCAVLVAKNRSKREVINDKDEDITQFFETLRDCGDELVAWLENVEYSRTLHQKWGEEYFNGERAENPVERAGRFFFLRHSQFSGKIISHGSFRTRTVPDGRRGYGEGFVNAVNALEDARDRFRGVTIENLDWESVVDRYDTPKTVFYFDPPYVDVGKKRYPFGDFDHDRFVSCLSGIDGSFIVSYGELPNKLASKGFHITEREQTYQAAHGNGGTTKATERLVCNFDPDETPSFSEANQSTLTAHAER